MNTALNAKIGFIGAKSASSALIHSLVNVRHANIIASNRDSGVLDDLSKRYPIEVTADNLEALEKSDYVFLSVKPKDLEGLLYQVRDSGIDYSGKVFISIVAGVRKKEIESILGDKAKIAIAMVTIGSEVGYGFSLYNPNGNCTENEKKAIETLLGADGDVMVTDEDTVIRATNGACNLGWDAMYARQNLLMLLRHTGKPEIARKYIINNLRATAAWLEIYGENSGSDADVLESLCLRVGQKGKSLTYAGVEELEFRGFYDAIESVHTLVGERMKK